MAENLVKLEITPEGQDALALMVPIGGIGRLFRLLSGEAPGPQEGSMEWPSGPVSIATEGDELLLTFAVMNCGQTPMAVRLRIGAGQPWPLAPVLPVRRGRPARRPAG